MQSLRERFVERNRFLLGVELVTTRGTMCDQQAIQARKFATNLVECEQVDWISITDNAGGNPEVKTVTQNTSYNWRQSNWRSFAGSALLVDTWEASI